MGCDYVRACVRAGVDGAQGNAGALDQLEAVRWIARHVACFGGDPARVTFFGESAGASSIGAIVTHMCIYCTVNGTLNGTLNGTRRCICSVVVQ